MILPEPRRDKIHQRGKAFLSTIVFAALCYVCLLGISLSLEKPSRQIFREVDLASFAPPAIEPAIDDSKPEESGSPETEEIESEPVLQEASEQSLDQLDLSQIFPTELTVELAPEAAADAARNSAADGSNSTDQIEVQSGGLQGLGSLDALDNLGGAPVPTSRGRPTRKPQSGNSGSIKIADGSSAVSPADNPVAAGGNTAVVGENNRRAATAQEADFDVQRLSLDSFGNDYKSLEILDLIAWMKAHPGEMPVGIEKLVHHRDEFLSSVTSFSLGGAHYELYLMCKPRLQELHIVIVEAEEATYLVDRSFQKLSTYLREGQVRRVDERGIIAVRSQRSEASNTRSTEFYSLFLSWWEIAKQEG